MQKPLGKSPRVFAFIIAIPEGFYRESPPFFFYLIFIFIILFALLWLNELSVFCFLFMRLKLVQNYIFLSKPLTRKKAILKGKNSVFLLGHSRLVRTEKYFNFANTPYCRKKENQRIKAFFVNAIYRKKQINGNGKDKTLSYR